MAKKRAIASLSVSLIARTKGFVKGLKKAMRSVKKFTRGIQALSARVAKMGVAFTAVALGGLAFFIKQSFASLDSLAKMADVLGVSANRLRGFQRAAELTGVTTEAINKGFIQLSKNIAEAATGTGEAIDALKALGLDAAKLIKLSPDKIFLRIADALDEIPGRVQKIGILADLLGARQVRLINLFDLGSDRIREMLAESVRLSGSFSRLDLSLIQQANDAFADMKRSLRGIIDRLAIEFAPLVEATSKRLTEMFVGFRERLPFHLAVAKMLIVKFLNWLERSVRQLGIAITKVAADAVTTLGEIIDLVPFGGNLAKRVRATGGRVAASAIGQQKSLDAATLLGDRLAGAIGKVVTATTDILKEMDMAKAKRQLENFVDWLTYGLPGFIVGTETALSKAQDMIVSAAARIVRQPGVPLPVKAMQISPSRTFVPGLYASRNRAQLVSDPQLARVIDELIQLNQRIERDASVAVTN